MHKYEEQIVHPELDKPTEVEKVLTVDALAKAIGRPLELSHAGEIGASDSGHGVFFALDTQDNTQSYAFKRFGNSQKAQREIDLLHEAANRGLKTLQTVLDKPLAVSNVRGVDVVTQRIPSLGTMNSIAWSEYYAGQPSYESDIVPIMESIGRYIGSLHANGMHHGDMQLKNIATIPSGEFVTFDLENAYFHADKESALQQVDFQDDCMKDITTVIESFARSGFMALSSDEIFWQEIQENLLQPYIEASDSLFLLDDDRHKALMHCIDRCKRIRNESNKAHLTIDRLVAHL